MISNNAIPKKMNAVVNFAPYDYRYVEVDVPEINEEEILLKVKACGICAGDIKSFHGSQMVWGGGIFPPWQKAPVIPGHEFIGEVVAIGDIAAEKNNLELGDLAISEQIVPCWVCIYCKTGRHWMCEKQDIHGHIREVAEGGMAEYMKYSSRDIVHKVPQSINVNNAAMIEPLSCAVHSVEKAEIGFNDVVVIAGLGPIGLCKLQLAKLKSPSLLVGIDMKPGRCELAKKLGADLVLTPAECDVVQEIKNITGGYGCDVYIHCSGNPKGVIQGLEMLRKQGTFVEFSVFMDDTCVNWSIIGDRKELTIKGGHISGQNGYKIAIDLLDKNMINVEDIVTNTFKLKDFKQAFDVSEKGDGSIKVLLIP